MVGTAQTRLCPPYVAVYFRLMPVSWTGTCGEVLMTLGLPSAIGRAALGQAPDRFQKQHILFGEHGISSSELASPLVWRDAGNS